MSKNGTLLILDFDGTIAIGDGPVHAYAREVSGFLDPETAQTLQDTLDSYLAGEQSSAGTPWAFKDGYDAVAQLSDGRLSPAQQDSAFQASRAAVARGEVEVFAPTGLRDFLNEVGESSHRLLFTNAPLTGVSETLTELGLADVIDEVIPNAHKPEGFKTHLPHLLANRRPHELLSVGDIWVNDLMHPLEAGCMTALIDRFGEHSGPSQLRAPSFPELYSGKLQWSRDPESFAAQRQAS